MGLIRVYHLVRVVSATLRPTRYYCATRSTRILGGYPNICIVLKKVDSEKVNNYVRLRVNGSEFLLSAKMVRGSMPRTFYVGLRSKRSSSLLSAMAKVRIFYGFCVPFLLYFTRHKRLSWPDMECAWFGVSIPRLR